MNASNVVMDRPGRVKDYERHVLRFHFPEIGRPVGSAGGTIGTNQTPDYDSKT